MLPCLRKALSVCLLTAALLLSGEARGTPKNLASLYKRIAKNLKAGKPMVVTLHVALCDNRIISCGNRRLGNGDAPSGNLYWGGGSGVRSWFDAMKKFRRIHTDKGDGKVIIERVVYHHRVQHPTAAWRRRGVTKPFHIFVVGLAYRGTRISQAMGDFLTNVSSHHTSTIKTKKFGEISYGGSGHVVGYLGHNYLMDVKKDFYKWPRFTRKQPIGYFALACKSAPYLAPRLTRPQTHALTLTRILMYPGAFTAYGLIEGLAQGDTQKKVFLRGVRWYSRKQNQPLSKVRWYFTHDARLRFRKRYTQSL